MITSLQINETKLVAGGRFLPGIIKRVNNWVGKPVEEAAKVVVKGAETVAKAAAKVLDFKVVFSGNNKGDFDWKVEGKPAKH